MNPETLLLYKMAIKLLEYRSEDLRAKIGSIREIGVLARLQDEKRNLDQKIELMKRAFTERNQELFVADIQMLIEQDEF